MVMYIYKMSSTLLPPPLLDLRMIAAEEHIGDFESPEVLRSRVMRVFLLPSEHLRKTLFFG